MAEAKKGLFAGLVGCVRERREGGSSWFTSIITCIALWVDDKWKAFDLTSRAHTEFDPPSWRHRLVGHSPSIMLVTLAMVLSLVNGPSLDRGFLAAGAALVTWALLLIVNGAIGRAGRREPQRLARPISWAILLIWFAGVPATLLYGFDPLWTPTVALLLGVIGCLVIPQGIGYFGWYGILLLAGAFTWWSLAEPDVNAHSGQPYRHILVPLILAVSFFALLFNSWWAWFLLADRRDDYRDAFTKALNETQLFDPRIASRAKASDILRSYINAPVSQPVLLLAVPSIVILLCSAERFLLLGGIALFLWWTLVAMTVFHPRLNGLLVFLRSLLAEGAALLFSVVVIAFAVSRVFGVSYVTTILDSTAGGVITQSLFFLYALVWFYDYWTDRAINDALLGLLHPDEDRPSEVAYVPPSSDQESPCRILPHGGSRWLVVRYAGEGRLHYNFFHPLEIFQRVASATKVMSRPRRLLPRLQSQIRFYRPLGAVFLGLLLWSIAGHYLSPRNHPRRFDFRAPETSAAASMTYTGSFPWEEASSEEPIVFVAASGGGTRAALYTQAAMAALRNRSALQHVKVVSSVSGGGLTNAFLASWRDTLLAEETNGPTWTRFREAVLMGHIDHVLRGAFEWRLVKEDRLGQLLRESFELALDAPQAPGPRRRSIEECRDIGLIFNTALAGYSATPTTLTAEASGENAGGRLVFTNLGKLERTGKPWAEGYEAPYVIVRGDNVSLEAAAAASANFPPVFSNLPVDL